jgi:hypothetical protein
MFNKKLKLLGLIVFVIGLYVILIKVVIPITYNAAKSDLYLDGSDDNGSQFAVSSPMSDMAYKHCNTYIEKELDDGLTATFAPQTINAWDIGSYIFLVNGEIEIRDQNGASTLKKYVCRIKYGEGDQSIFDNWSVYGVSGLDEI